MKKLLHHGATFGLLLATLLVGLMATSCKKEVDLSGTMIGIADKNIPATYSYTVVDSTAMSMTIYEYALKEDKTGEYRIITMGNLTEPSSSTKAFTWDRIGFTEDDLAIRIAVTFEDAEQPVVVLWGSHAINDGVRAHPDGARTAALNTVATTWPNLSWKSSAVTYYTKPMWFKYLKWEQVSERNVTKDKVAKINAELALMKDTIAWFNKYMGYTPDMDQYVYDTVELGAWNASKNYYKTVLYYKSVSDSVYKPKGDTIGLQSVKDIKMSFTRDASGAQKGTYYYRLGSYSKEYYTEPGSAKATASDSIVEATISAWNYASVASAKKFVLMAKGDKKTTLISAQGSSSSSETNAWMSFSISDFVLLDTLQSMVYDEVSFVKILNN